MNYSKLQALRCYNMSLLNPARGQVRSTGDLRVYTFRCRGRPHCEALFPVPRIGESEDVQLYSCRCHPSIVAALLTENAELCHSLCAPPCASSLNEVTVRVGRIILYYNNHYYHYSMYEIVVVNIGCIKWYWMVL